MPGFPAPGQGFDGSERLSPPKCVPKKEHREPAPTPRWNRPHRIAMQVGLIQKTPEGAHKCLDGGGGGSAGSHSAGSNGSRARRSALRGHPSLLPPLFWVSLRAAGDGGFNSGVGSSCGETLSQRQQAGALGTSSRSTGLRTFQAAASCLRE